MVKIIYKNGNPFIEINSKQIVPAAFRSFRPTPANISMFHRLGVRLFQMIVSGTDTSIGNKYSYFGQVWDGDGKYNFENFDKQIDMFLKFAPDSYICVMIVLDTPKWWLEENPEAFDSYCNLGKMVTNEKWRRDATEYLKALIEYAEKKYGDKIFCYSFSGGFGTEWFSQDFGEKTPAKEKLYRKFLNDETVKIPSEEDYLKGESVYREPDSNEYKYLKFASQFTPDLICEFAAHAQSVINHKKLIGLFFGYCDMLPVHQSRWLTNGYEKVWQCPDIDMIFSPAAYQHNRDIDGVSSYQLAVDSIAANGKLYLHEIDHRTELACFPLENGSIIGDCYTSQEDCINVLRRELANTICKQSALWWFDFFGGYYSSPVYERELARHIEIFNEFAESENKNVSEIAVFVDPMSFLYFKETTNIAQSYVRFNIDSLLRLGAPFEFFNLNDLPKLNTDKYKMFVFLNAVEINNDLQEFIDKKLAGKYKFFLGAPGYANTDKLSTDSISNTVNMNVEQFECDKPVVADYNGKLFSFSNSAVACMTNSIDLFDEIVTPCFRICDSDAQSLCKYSNGLGVAAAEKDNTLYCAVGCIPPSLFTYASKKAGVHIYTENESGLAVSSNLLCIYSKEENVTITMPQNCRLTDMFSGDIYETKNCVFSYTAKPFETKLLKVENL